MTGRTEGCEGDVHLVAKLRTGSRKEVSGPQSSRIMGVIREAYIQSKMAGRTLAHIHHLGWVSCY